MATNTEPSRKIQVKINNFDVDNVQIPIIGAQYASYILRSIILHMSHTSASAGRGRHPIGYIFPMIR